MYMVGKRLATTFIIYLEPDLLVRGRHRVDPPHDAGGIYDNYNPQLKAATVVYLERRARKWDPCFQVHWHHFGLAGGSYFRTEAILDAFDPVHVATIDFKGMFKKEGDKALSSDFVMHMALTSRAWIVYPWAEAAQNLMHRGAGVPKDKELRRQFAERWPAFNLEAAFEHDHKEHYRDSAPADAMAKIKRGRGAGSVECHGCVWYAGPAFETRLKVPSAAPAAVGQDILYDVDASLKDRPKACPGREVQRLRFGNSLPPPPPRIPGTRGTPSVPAA